MKNQAQIIKKYGKTFYWASFFLEKKFKLRLFSIYAFCREIDDMVDNKKEKDNYIKKNFQKKIEGFKGSKKSINSSKEIIGQFILGQKGDLSHKQPKSLNELTIYCYRVAGIVGLMVCDALNVKDIKIRHYAIDLGIAMQLTNICRDIKEDSHMGRVYLPQNLVGKLKAGEVEFPNENDYKKIKVCQNKLLKIADDYYASAEHAIPFLPGRTSLAIKIAAKLYQAIGKKIINNDISYLKGRAFITKYEKLKITLTNIISINKTPTKINTHNKRLHAAIMNLPGAH
ncbi:MAG: squalene/phytoene synthase family protein [Methylophilaceae bacterium]|nr:squalene/phytoene synthase family protein [Methylophilaceae bacterium]